MQDFTNKRNALFACLDEASGELKGTTLDQSIQQNCTIDVFGLRQDTSNSLSLEGSDCRSNAAVDKSLKRMRGKESLFKKPELPIGRCLKPRRTPDYQVNPQKWKKYSLSDVDISDHTNTAAAFAFLKQMDKQKEAAASEQEQKVGDKIEFKKSAKIIRKLNARISTDLEDPELDKPHLKGSKLMMPEYVIGQKQHQKSTKRTIGKNLRTHAAGTLTLSHLTSIDDGGPEAEGNDE